MTIGSVPLAPARAAQQVLSQYLLPCPGCAKPAMAHVDGGPGSQIRLVRLVCPGDCIVDAAAVLAALPIAAIGLTA